jgi:glutamine cyclotransferase
MANKHNGVKPFIRIVLVFLALLILGLVVFLFGRELFATSRPVSSIPTELAPQMTYEVINEFPHDSDAFTQGLIYLDGFFYESTGLYGESSLRKVAIESGEVMQKIDLLPEYFAEGLTHWDGGLIQLTWRENTGFVYDLEDFSLTDQFSYPTEGWGLTHDGKQLIMSDGSSTLYFLDPGSYRVVDQITVTRDGQEVVRLNELEYILGEVFANIWQTDMIIRINPENGEVQGEINMSGILPAFERTAQTDVLNGIAYDPETDRLFITGKLWPKVFEIRLVSQEPLN